MKSYYAFNKGYSPTPDTDGFHANPTGGLTISKNKYFVHFFAVPQAAINDDQPCKEMITEEEAKKIAVELLIKMIVDRAAMLEADLRDLYHAINKVRELPI